MTNTPTPASHAVNTAPISADLWGVEQAAPQHVATVWVDDDGCNDFEQSPFFNLPAGEHKLYTGAASASPAKHSTAQHSTAQHSRMPPPPRG